MLIVCHHLCLVLVPFDHFYFLEMILLHLSCLNFLRQNLCHFDLIYFCSLKNFFLCCSLNYLSFSMKISNFLRLYFWMMVLFLYLVHFSSWLMMKELFYFRLHFLNLPLFVVVLEVVVSFFAGEEVFARLGLLLFLLSLVEHKVLVVQQ